MKFFFKYSLSSPQSKLNGESTLLRSVISGIEINNTLVGKNEESTK